MAVTLIGDASKAASALPTDLEYEGLLGDPSLREAHLRREERRVVEVLAQGGLGLRWEPAPRGETTRSALALLRYLPWDSAHFGVPCADLLRLYLPAEIRPEEIEELITALLEATRRRGVRLLSARVRADRLLAVQTLQRLGGFLLVDTSVEIGGLRPLPPPPSGGPLLRDALPTDLPALEEIAASFTENRFHRDPGIPREKAAKVYLSWVRAAAAGRRGSLLLAERDGEVAGFATYLPADDELGVDVVGLLAVHPRRRGGGVLHALVAGCAERLSGRAVVTSTQVSNAAALRGFGRAGLRPFGARHVLHGWL